MVEICIGRAYIRDMCWASGWSRYALGERMVEICVLGERAGENVVPAFGSRMGILCTPPVAKSVSVSERVSEGVSSD